MSRKMPIKEIMVCSENNCFKDQVKEFEKYIISESYVLNIRYENINDYFNKLITPNKGEIGKKFKQDSMDSVESQRGAVTSVAVINRRSVARCIGIPSPRAEV